MRIRLDLVKENQGVLFLADFGSCNASYLQIEIVDIAYVLKYLSVV